MKTPRSIYKLILVLLLTTTGIVKADTFTLTSVDAAMNSQGQTSLTFSIDPTQVVGYSLGDYFQAVATSGDFGQFYVAFGSSSYAANLGIFADFGLFYFNGEQLYSGTEENPNFLAGTYDLTNFDGIGYTLTIMSGTAATPEPSTLVLLGFGLAGLFWVGRSRYVDFARSPR